LKLGDVTIRAPLTELSADRGGAGAADAFPNNIGGGVLKRFVVTLDYDHSTLYMKPLPGPVADLDTFDRSGMWINAAAGGFEVVDVAAGGPAGAAGLEPGDLVAEVDGQPASGLALSALRERWRNQAPGTVVVLTVRRGASAARSVKLTLRDQL
jgi:S1-C subfamily serine protease